MVIEHVIIHEIKKKSREVGAKVLISNSCLDVTEPIISKLVEDLNDRYANKSETYGVFDSKNETRFQEEFIAYQTSPSLETFTEFTKKTTRSLREKIDSIAPAKGGYLVFAKYNHYRDYIGVFLVRNTDGLSFKRNSSTRNYSIKKAMHIDFEKMAMACRINLIAYSNNETRYLNFINKKSDAMSLYFMSWISSTDNESDESDTIHLYSILKQIPTPNDENGESQTKEVFLEKIYRHIQSAGKKVNIHEIGRLFYNDENKISNYAASNDLRITTEFKAHKTVLRKFIQIRARANNIELSFPKDLLNSVIRIPDNNPNQIIIDSPELAEKIRTESNND
jgi:nucleoid-associated protein YejK